MLTDETGRIAESLYEYFSKFDKHIYSPDEIKSMDKTELLEELKEQVENPKTIDDVIADIEDLTATYDESLCAEGMSLIVELKDLQAELYAKEKIRMVGNYEVIHAIHIGKKEVVFMTDKNDKESPYAVAYCSTDNPFNVNEYSEMMGGDDYVELMNLFSERLNGQIKEVEKEKQERNIPDMVLGYEHCIPKSELGDYTNQIIVIKASCIRAEYRTADKQLYLATSGNGCEPNSIGRAVYVTNLYSGKTSRWNRVDVAGIIKPECLPEWAKKRLPIIQAEKEKRNKTDKEVR